MPTFLGILAANYNELIHRSPSSLFILFGIAAKKDLQQMQPDDTSDNDSSSSAYDINDRANTQVFDKKKIFVRGLPLEMSEQRLFDTLWDVFNTVGRIKVIKAGQIL